MRLCVGTSKGIVMLDPDRAGAPLMVLADPSSIWCLARDCRDPNLIYAGAAQYLHVGIARGASALSRSTDGGRTWSDITPRTVREDDIWALATPPNGPGELFIATPRARLFRSVDTGRTFEECKGFLEVPGRDRWTSPTPPHVARVRSIAFDPSNPSTMYLGIEEGGVVRSRDRGKSFEPLNHGIHPAVHCVAVDPNDSRRLYATSARGFYRSQDGGGSWQPAMAGLTRRYTVPLAVHPRIGGLVYTAAAAGTPPTWSSGINGADSLLFRSLDGGESFEPIGAEAGPRRAMVMKLMAAFADHDELFATTTDGTVMRSRDRGDSFTAIATRLPPAYDLLLLP